ncbi:uncharacterized protein LOC108035770 [Drosophila biarmipes]|uniref:uncharacterized protein LOC108035770 n=1 Tax=Drosophila biarmipes TaxID=125945 RepID=UPI0007E5C317|nr:uncharacterized protein LOC108035770 [Drosophila biarmipes]
MSQVEKQHLESPPEAGAGSPGEASSVAVAADATETEKLVEKLLGMGFPEGQARIALAGCHNNVELAVQLMVAGEESKKQRRGHQGLRQLRESLLGNPFSTNKAIEQMMRSNHTVQALAEFVKQSGVEAMQLLLADPDLGPEGSSSAGSSSSSDSAEN